MKDFSSHSANSQRSLTFTVLSSSGSKVTRSRSLTNLHSQLSFNESFAVVESTLRPAKKQQQQQLFDFADFDAFVASQNNRKKGRNSSHTASTWDLNDDICDKSCASVQTRETLLMEETSYLSSGDLWAGVHAEVSPRVVQRDCFGFPIYDLQADTPPPPRPPPSAPAESAAMTPEEAEKAARRARRRRSAATKRKSDSAIQRHSRAQTQASAAASSSCSPPMRMGRSLSSGGIYCAALREENCTPPLLSPAKQAKNSSRENNRNSSPVVLSPPKPASKANGSHSRPKRNKSLGGGGISQLVEVEARSSSHSKRKHQSFPKTKGGSHHIPTPPPTSARRRKSLGDGGLMTMAVTITMMPKVVKGKCHTIPTPPTTTSTKPTPRRRKSLGDGGMATLMQGESYSSSTRRRRSEKLNNIDPHRRRSRSRNSSLLKSFNESTEIATAMAAAAVAAAMTDQSVALTPAERRRARRTSGSGDDNPGAPLKKFGRSRRSSAPMALLEATADNLLVKPCAFTAIC